MDYIHDLRKLVGSRPLIMVGAALLALNQNNQLLMIRRTDNGCWGIPGGSMELGETLENTIIRETKEEIGIEIKEIHFFKVYSGQDLHYQYPNGDEVYMVSIVYLTRDLLGNLIINPVEHTEYQYFDIHNLPARISPPIIPILADLQEQMVKKS